MFQTPLAVKEVVIRSGFDGNRVVLSDVATVEEGFKETKKRYRFKGRNTINIIIFKKEKSDILQVSQSAKRLLNEFKSQVPETIKVEQIVDYSDDTRRLLNLVKSNAILGLILVLITLILFLNL